MYKRQIDILIVINVYDELLFPIGLASFQGSIIPGMCEYMFGLTIPYHAHSGNGEVFANALTDWPHNGGVPYCPQVSSNFLITP